MLNMLTLTFPYMRNSKDPNRSRIHHLIRCSWHVNIIQLENGRTDFKYTIDVRIWNVGKLRFKNFLLALFWLLKNQNWILINVWSNYVYIIKIIQHKIFKKYSVLKSAFSLFDTENEIFYNEHLIFFTVSSLGAT